MVDSQHSIQFDLFAHGPVSEQWKLVADIPGYEVYTGYRVSSWGNVETCKRVQRTHERYGFVWLQDSGWMAMHPHDDKDGYQVVRLSSGLGTQRQFIRMHVLVLLAFGPPRLRGQWGLHKDDNPGHNHIENLYWGNNVQNSQDAKKNKKIRLGQDHPKAKLTEAQVLAIYARLRAGEAQPILAKEFNVTHATIWCINHQRTWRHLWETPA